MIFLERKGAPDKPPNGCFIGWKQQSLLTLSGSIITIHILLMIRRSRTANSLRTVMTEKLPMLMTKLANYKERSEIKPRLLSRQITERVWESMAKALTAFFFTTQRCECR